MNQLSASFPIDVASAVDDEAISQLARLAGLKIDPAAERGRVQAHLLVARSAEDHAQVLGFVLGWVVADEVELLDVCVREDSRRSGIGASLVAALFHRAQGDGATSAFLEVRASNRGAIALYEGIGFSESGKRLGYYSDGEDALLFRCCLSPSR